MSNVKTAVPTKVMQRTHLRLGSPIFQRLVVALFAMSFTIGVIAVFATASLVEQADRYYQQNRARGFAKRVAQEIEALGGTLPQALQRIDYLYSVLPGLQAFVVNQEGRVEFAYAEGYCLYGSPADLVTIKQYANAGPTDRVPDSIATPCDESARDIFSAAPMTLEGKPSYLLLLLGARSRNLMLNMVYLQYGSVSSLLLVILILALAAVLATLTLRFITRRFAMLVATVQAFSEGEYSARMNDSAKDEIGALSTTFDAMADSLQTTMQTLSERDEVRRQLIADVSHDLRGPVQILRLGIDAMRTHPEYRIPAPVIQPIEGNLRKLQQLLHELFELAKLEAKAGKLELIEIECAEFLHEIVDRYSILAASNDITLSAETPEYQVFVAADPELLQRAIGNLLENAMQHTTAKGRVILRIATIDDRVRITVSDTGAGISSEEQQAVFARYAQASNSNTLHSGAGLGLSIVKKIVETHGSTIHVASELGVGTDFWFELPRVTI